MKSEEKLKITKRIVKKNKKDWNELIAEAIYGAFEKGVEAGMPEWIYYKDELPPMGEKVLICSTEGDVELGMRFHQNEWMVKKELYSITDFQYWIPVPKLPEV